MLFESVKLAIAINKSFMRLNMRSVRTSRPSANTLKKSEPYYDVQKIDMQTCRAMNHLSDHEKRDLIPEQIVK